MTIASNDAQGMTLDKFVNDYIRGYQIFSLELTKIDHRKLMGIYGPGRNKFAERMAYIHPSAEDDIYAISSVFVFSDMHRSFQSATKNVIVKPKLALPPPRCGHFFCLSIDGDIAASMKKLGTTSKPELDAYMANRHFYCHRTDGKLGAESWHYNHLPGFTPGKKLASTAAALDARIVEIYGAQFIAAEQFAVDLLRTHEPLRQFISALFPEAHADFVKFATKLAKQWKVPLGRLVATCFMGMKGTAT